MGETLSLTQEFVEKCARDEQANCIVPSLAPHPQAAPPCSKEGCPAWVNTEAPPPYNLSEALSKEIWPK